jgi:hypothetical protein
MNIPMGGIIHFLRKVLFNDSLIRAVPFLTLLAGVLGFALSYLVWDTGTLHEIIKSFSQVVLASGLVSVLINSFKYMGIFKEAVHEVMFSPDHLRQRSDLPALWSRVTSVICQEKFPQLAERLHADVLAKYVPAGKDFYYSGYSRETTISVVPDDPDIVSIYEELDLSLHPADPAKEVFYSYYSKVDSRTPRELAEIELIQLSVDGIVKDIDFTVSEYDDEFGGTGVMQKYTIPLSGKNTYKIRRATRRRLCITRDPVIEYSSQEFILGCVAKFRAESPGIVPVFQSVGTEDFDDQTMGPDGNWQVHRVFHGLMFPRQGYILFIQRQV